MTGRIYRNVFEMERIAPSVCTLGFFDGLHLGHRLIFSTLKEIAAEQGLSTAALTFTNSLPPGATAKNRSGFLMNADDKAERIAALGIDNVVLQTPGPDFFGLSPESFISEILVGKLNVKAFLAGPDLRFGKGRAGDPEVMERLGREYGFELTMVVKVEHLSEPISSSRVKQTLLDGEMELATQLLGRPYELEGEIVKGDGVGRTLGFPTANLCYAPDRLLPMYGVFFGHVTLSPGESNEERHPAAMNIGLRPTFNKAAPAVEAWLKGVDNDLYGRKAVFHIEKRLRGEIKFESIEDLKLRMQDDVHELDRWLESNDSA